MARVPKIPGGLPDVTEWSPEGSQPSRLTPNQPEFHGNGRYGGTPNPANPTAPAPAATNAGAAAEAGAAQKVGMGRRIADGLRSLPGRVAAAPGQVAGLADAPLGAGVQRAASALRSAASGTAARLAVPLTYAMSAKQTFDTPTEDIYARTGIDPVASHVPQVVKDLGVRSLGALQDLGNTFTGGLAGKAGEFLAGDSGGPVPAAARPTTPAAPNPTDARLAAGSAAPPQFATAPQPSNMVLRNGNSFSGDNVKQGFGYQGAPGRTLGGGNMEDAPGTGGLSVMQTPGVEGYMKQLSNLRAIGGPAEQGGGAVGIGGNGSSGAFGFLTGAARDATMDPNWMANHDTGGPMSGRQKLRIQNNNAQIIAAQAQMGESQRAMLREGGEMSRAGLGASTQRRGQDIQAANAGAERDIQARGQDISYAGHMAPLQLAAMQRGMHRDVYQAVGASGTPSADHHLAAAARFDAMGLTEQAKGARDAAAQMQTLKGTQETQSAAAAAGTERLFKPMFTRTVIDAQGNPRQEFDDVGAAKAAATVRGVHGERFDRMTDAEKRDAMTKIVAQQRNMDAERQVTMGFADRAKDLVGMYEKPPEATAPRDLRGGVPERAGLLSPPGVSRNATLLRLPNGQTINYGEMTDSQIEELKPRLRQR